MASCTVARNLSLACRFRPSNKTFNKSPIVTRYPITRPSFIISASSQKSNSNTSSLAKVSQFIQTVESNIPEALKTWFGRGLELMQKPAVVFLLMAALTMASPDFALAAKSGGRVGGSNFSSRSYSAPSQSYSAPSYSSPSYSAPFFAPAPYYGWSPFSFFAPAPTVIVGGGGGGIFGFLFLGAILLIIANAVTGFLSNDSDDIYVSEKTSVVKLQVGLLGLARTLQRDLDRIADRADTSSSEGLHYILSETSLALLRHPNYCVYGHSTSKVERSVEEGESTFNRFTFEERSKLKEETLVNVGNVRKRAVSSTSEDRFGSEYILVTIIAATEGSVKLPEIKNSNDLREALSIIGSIPEDQLQAVEILWTPQEEDDTLSAQELLVDYPSLRAL